MVDFWYTLGAMVMNKGLLDAVGSSRPVFVPITETVTEVVGGHPSSFTVKAAGHLDSNSTTLLRGVIRDFLNSKGFKSPPPVSLYTAAKFCQFWNTFQAGIQNAINQAYLAYQDAVKKKAFTPSAHFPTLLGASLVDDLLSLQLRTMGTQDVAREFGIVPDPQLPEWSVIIAWLNDGRVTGSSGAVQTMLNAPSWDHGCRERFIYYDKFMRAAN